MESLYFCPPSFLSKPTIARVNQGYRCCRSDLASRSIEGNWHSRPVFRVARVERPSLRTAMTCAGLAWLLPLGAAGQALATSTAGVPARIPIVASALTAAGLTTPLNALPHLQATGSQVKSVGASTESSAVSLSIQAGGAIQLSVDSTAGQRTESYSAYSGKIHVPKLPDKTLDARTASLSRLIYLPVLELAEVSADAAANVTASEPIEADGHKVYIVTVTNHWPDLGSTGRSTPPQMSYYIDAVTFQIVRRDDTLVDERDPRVTYARTVRYDSFAPAGLLVLPYKATETLANQNLAITQWSTFSITF